MPNSPPRIIAGIVPVPQQEAVLLLECGYLWLEMGQPRKAQELFSGVCDLLPHSDVARVALGNLHMSQGRYAQALKCHDDALTLQPDSRHAKVHRAEALLFLKKRDEGLSILREIIAKNSEDDDGKFAEALLAAAEEGAF
jgi:predicted Zn-dependent protease